MTTANTKSCHNGFNYCAVAKTIVAIPAIPLVAVIAASFFTSVVLQIVAGAAAVAALIYAAIKIDQMPCLLRKVVSKKDSQ